MYDIYTQTTHTIIPTHARNRLKQAIEEETEVVREIAEEINAGFGQRIFPMVASSNHCAFVSKYIYFL